MPDKVVTDRYMLIICLYSEALLPLLLTWLRNSTMASEGAQIVTTCDDAATKTIEVILEKEFEQQITEIKRKGLAECMLEFTKKDKECLK